MATPEEIIAMNEAEQQRLAAAGLGGIGSKTVTPTPALAPSANAYVAPEIPQITSLSTPPPIEPAPTLGDGQVSAANERLGNAAHDASLGTVAGLWAQLRAGDPTVSPVVAATSQAADQTNAAIQAKAEPTGAAFAEAVFGDPKPAQSQAPVDPNDPYAADRNKMEKDGVKAIDESFKIEMGAATRDDRHLNPETGAMDPGGNNILDAEEIAAHVSSIESAWREADEGIKARVALDYKNNLEKLQEEQHRIKAQYSAMVDEVANTYINPAELWDKGGFGARIGIPGAAFLDTFFAMKGWNVPSFSAQWDKAVEGNVIAQTSKLAQKTGKLAGFEKLWNMAGQIATNEKEQIAYTSDLLKAATMGQYVHQLAPFKSLAAAADAQAMKADAMRKIGTMMMNQVNNMDQMALRRKTQVDADALARLKYELEAEKLRQLKKTKEAGSGMGDLLRPPKGDEVAVAERTVDGILKMSPGQMSEKTMERLIPLTAGASVSRRLRVLNKIVTGEDNKAAQLAPIMLQRQGAVRLVGYYDATKNNEGVKTVMEKVTAVAEAEADLAKFNEDWREVVKQYAGDPSKVGIVDIVSDWKNRKLGDVRRTPAEQRLLASWARIKGAVMHANIGAGQTASEVENLAPWLPKTTNAAGHVSFGVSGAMGILVDDLMNRVEALGRSGQLTLLPKDPTTYSEKNQARIADTFIQKPRMPLDLDLNTEVARTAEKESDKPDPKNSALQPRGTMRSDGTFGVVNAVAPDAEDAFVEKAKRPGVALSAAEEASFAKLKSLPGQAEAEVERVWNEDKASWKGVKLLMDDSWSGMKQFRDRLPADYRPAVDAAMNKLTGLRQKAKAMEAKMRESSDSEVMNALGIYDHRKAERPESLAARSELTQEYRAILESVYSDPAALIQPNLLKVNK